MVFEIVIHCFGQQFESFEVDEDRFSFVCLYDNVKFITCNERLILGEKPLISVKVKLPWTRGAWFHVNNDQDLLELFREFSEHNVSVIHFHCNMLPVAEMEPEVMDPVEPDPPEPEPEHQPQPDSPQPDPEPKHQSQPDSPVSQVSSPSSETEPQTQPQTKTKPEFGSDEVEISDESDKEWQGEDSNNEDSQFGSDEENENKVARLSRLMKRNLYKPLPDGKHHLQVGQTFKCAAEFRKVLTEYSIQEGFNIYRVKNEKSRVTCECAATGCGWRVHASLMADNITFQIKTLREDHSCTMLSKNPMVTCEWLSRKIEDKIRCNPGIKIKDLKKEVREMIGVHVSKAKLYRAKNRVLERLGGDHGASYSRLHNYGNILLCKNPGTMAQVKCHRDDISENPVFQRFFLSFPAQKDGFLKGCRPFIGVDGCHLKGQFGGVLLTAVSVDANNNIFPLAFSVCEGENYDSWIWFLNLISEYIGVHETRRICFMSDRQKGLLKAINEVFPNAFNRYCARHIFANFNSHFPGVKVRNLFWAASRSTNIRDFNVVMEGIKAVDLGAYTWLKDIPVDSWSKHAFGTDVKVDHVTNNLTESFNSQINSIKNKSILQLVESLRRKVMKKFTKREQKAKEWLTDLPPSIQAKLNKFQREGRHIQVIHAGNSEFEVLHESVTVLVDFNKATCDCGVWQIYGIPCKHAMACITHLGVSPIPYVASCLSKEAYMLTYAGKIHPIPDESSWPQMEADKIHPPTNKRKPGRPKLIRRRESDEPAPHKRSYVLKCGVCKAMGHNKRTCPNVPLHAKKKKKSDGTAGDEGNLINAQEHPTVDAQKKREEPARVDVAQGTSQVYTAAQGNAQGTSSSQPQGSTSQSTVTRVLWFSQP